LSLTDDLYRDIILEHFRNPRNSGLLENPDLQAQGANPFCGDELTLTLKLNGEQIETIKMEGKGCSISQASASMLTDAVTGKTFAEAEQIAKQFKGVMLENAPADFKEDLEDLNALEGVKIYPVRIKCAILGWNTLLEAITAHRKGEHQATHTEGEEGNRPELAQQMEQSQNSAKASTFDSISSNMPPASCSVLLEGALLRYFTLGPMYTRMKSGLTPWACMPLNEPCMISR